MELVTKSKRPGMDCTLDVYFEQTVGLPKNLNDKTCYKMVLLNSGSFIVEDNGKYIVITTPAAILINEKAEFKVVSEDNIKARTIYFKPSVLREEFTLEALNSGKFYKFLSALKSEETDSAEQTSATSTTSTTSTISTIESIKKLIAGDIKFEDSFSSEMVYQDALLLLGFFWHNRDVVYYSITKQEFDTLRRLFVSVQIELNTQPDNFWILRTRYFIQSILFMATADFYRNNRQDDIYNDRLVAWVTRYFWDHIDEEITLDSVLKLFSVNKNTLNDAFNKEVSMSCMTYLEQMRINLAKSELQFGTHTVSEISVGVGYKDTNYFTKVFKKHTGMTPSEFQKQMRDLC